MEWILMNLGNLVVGLFVVATMVWAIRNILNRKKRGCTCGCSTCTVSEGCRMKKEKSEG